GLAVGVGVAVGESVSVGEGDAVGEVGVGVEGSAAKARWRGGGLSVSRRDSVADACVIAAPPVPASATVPSSAPRMENLIILLLWEISGQGLLFRLVKIGQD
ncbi:hypothetical protein, partial [Nonomuraea terrae]|uniref:hypothetical protein n=1 Tax=Nonomuraea terrae TaxID=2530383 RepID=UPI001CB74D77